MDFNFTEDFINSKINELSDVLNVKHLHSSTVKLVEEIIKVFPKIYIDVNGFLMYDETDRVFKQFSFKDQKFFRILLKTFDNVYDKEEASINQELTEKADRKELIKKLEQLEKSKKRIVTKRFCDDIVSIFINFCESSSIIYSKNQKNNKHKIFYGNDRVINLKDGKIKRRTEKSNALTYINCAFLGWDEECTNARKFIFQLCNGDKDRVEALLSILGYCITNINNAKKMFIFYGKKANNGKSKLMEMMKQILGDYKCKPITQDLLIANNLKSVGEASPALLALRNATLGVLSELQDNQRLNETTFKSITGGDELTARQLYSGKMETFILPTKIVLHSNKPAYIDTGDRGSVNRLHVIFFDALFCKNPTKENEIKEDPDFLEKFMSEHSNEFFTLLIQYAKKYYEEGLIYNDATKKDLARYLNIIDPVHQFLENNYENSKNSIEYFNDIWGDFKAFCQSQRIPLQHQHKLKANLQEKLKKDYTMIKKTNKFRRGDMTAFKGIHNINNVDDEEEFGFDEIEENDITLCQNLGRIFKVYSFDPKGFTSIKQLKDEFDDIRDIPKILKNMNIPEIKRSIMGFRLSKINNEEEQKDNPKEEPKEKPKIKNNKPKKNITKKPKKQDIKVEFIDAEEVEL